MGKIWSLGADIDWSKFYPGESARKVSLPTYPFQQKYFWADSKIEAGDTNFNYPLHLYEPGWVKSNLDGDVERNYSGTWLIFSDKGNVALHCIERLNQNASSVTVIEPGDQFEQLSDQHYRIVPGSRDHIDAILKNYSLIEGEVLNVLHFWVLGDLGDEVSDFEKLQIHNKMGFATLLVLTQSIFASGFASHTEIKVVTSGIADVDTQVDRLQPTKAAILGPCMLAPQEIPGLEMRCIDVPVGIENQTGDFLLDAVFNEIGFRCKNTITALRDDGRFTQELFELPEISQ